MASASRWICSREVIFCFSFAKACSLSCAVIRPAHCCRNSESSPSASDSLRPAGPERRPALLGLSGLLTGAIGSVSQTSSSSSWGLGLRSGAFSCSTAESKNQATAASLSGVTYFDKDDTVSVEVTADDGTGIDTRTSDSVTVLYS